MKFLDSRFIRSLTTLILLHTSMNLYAGPHCGELKQIGVYGPFDYTNAEHKREKLPIVEAHHFTSDVEKLIRGSSGTIGADLNYTLMTFPNHHRALAAMEKLTMRDKKAKPVGARYSIDCYFDRAMRFNPTDTTVRALYSNHLLKVGKPDQALEQLEYALKVEPEDPTINYNLGLLYMQRKEYEKARAHAKKAYDQGFPLPGLKNRLVQAGKWEE
jgi:tetratricopeptide (TPR) repeat protein